MALHIVHGTAFPANNLYTTLDPFYRYYQKYERERIIEHFLALNDSLLEVLIMYACNHGYHS